MLESGFYSTDKGELLVVFGGRIRLSSYVLGDSIHEVYKELDLGELPEVKEIGESLGLGSKEEHEEFHPIRLQFSDDRSIDALIKQLQDLKNYEINKRDN